ncbi:MAG: hypothetical protein AMXMBFR61_10720 [Fimbriimonadales bacterium]
MGVRLDASTFLLLNIPNPPPSTDPSSRDVEALMPHPSADGTPTECVPRHHASVPRQLALAIQTFLRYNVQTYRLVE